MAEREYWSFPARVTNVVDGDTIDVTVDLGFNARRDVRLRLAGLDTAEIYAPSSEAEYQRGKDQAQFVREWLAKRDDGSEWPLVVQTKKEKGKFGRYVAHVHGPGGESLNDALIDAYPEVDDD